MVVTISQDFYWCVSILSKFLNDVHFSKLTNSWDVSEAPRHNLHFKIKVTVRLTTFKQEVVVEIEYYRLAEKIFTHSPNQY